MTLHHAAKILNDDPSPKVDTFRMNLFLQLFLVPTILVIVQLYHAFTLREHFHGVLDDKALPRQETTNKNKLQFRPIKSLNIEESFGACLMIKEDNDLLYEWLAYHYTTLPLRYVYVVSDEGSRQNPHDVFHRWKNANTGLHFWVVNATDFMNTHEIYIPRPETPGNKKRGNYTVEHEEAHHAFVQRQRVFITKCVEFMHAQGLHWVTLTDTDEFLVMNRVVEHENISVRDDKTPKKEMNAIHPTAYRRRHSLPSLGNQTTVLDVIHELERTDDFGPCYTIPRLLYGALENVSCPQASTAVRIAQNGFRYNALSTLRFNQHARKGDFAKSKFGKVMLDISRLSNETIQSTPRNIHRPYKPECGPGVVSNFAESVFFLNHYIGSWERYNSRQDHRRNSREWEVRAHLTTDTSCDHGVHEWFPRFLDLMGEERAQYLLGVTDLLQESIPVL